MKNQSLALSLFCFVLGTNQLSAQLPKGDRTMSWLVDKTENDDFVQAFEFAQAGCIESSHLSVTWSDIEPTDGLFDSDILNIFNTADYFYTLYSTELELQLAVTNTVVKTVPDDLLAVDYNDPSFINRYKRVLDSVFAHLPTVELSALNIGNESDILFGTDPLQYEAYKTFLDAVIPYAKTRYFELYGRDLKVGTTLTLYGLIDPIKGPLCETLNDGLDIVSVTYYPLENDFTMKPIDAVEPDFDALIAIYDNPSQPIYFAECGFSSSEICNSSEILQAQFYSEVFRLWDKHYDYIKHLTIFKSTDWSYDAIDYLAGYYGIDDPIFLEYLRTLGVRTWDGDGTNKLAYDFILCELEARDWCTTSCALTGIEQNKNTVELALVPNPCTNQFIIQSDQALAHVKLFSLTGAMVYESSTGSTRIDTSELPTGIYFIEIETINGERRQEKIIKITP